MLLKTDGKCRNVFDKAIGMGYTDIDKNNAEKTQFVRSFRDRGAEGR